MKIKFSKIDISKALILPEDLLKFLDKANGEFIKVYIYLLKNAKEDINVGDIADDLFMLEADVGRALKYWKENGLLDISDNLINQEPEKKPNTAAKEEIIDNTPKEIRSDEIIEKKEKLNLEKLRGDEEFSSLVYLIQQHMKSDFNASDMYTLGYIYDGLKLPPELIEYLIDLCVQKGKSSLRYMEKVAIDWHSKGIKTVKGAKEHSNIYSKEVWSVMRALGQSNRNPAPVEVEFIRKWFGQWAFTEEIVIEACRRAVLNIQTPSFNYVDGILEKWHTKGVRVKADIEKLDKEHETRKEAAKTNVANTSKNKTNKFNNFEQRTDDLDAYVMEQLKEHLG